MIKNYLLTIGGFLIGAFIGGVILYRVIKNARNQFQNMAEEDEKEWAEQEAKETEEKI